MITFSQLPTLHQFLFLAGIVAFFRLILSTFSRIRVYLIRKRIRTIIDELATLYKLENPFQVSRCYRKEHKISSHEYVYGEIVFASFTDVLSVAKPQPGEKYYDLGCGSGKSVFLTSLLYEGVSANGVEILPPMYELDLKLLKKMKAQLKKSPHFKSHPLDVNFYNADLFDFDLSDADIVFINATCYSKKSMEKIEKKLKTLKSGARIIISSKKLKDKCFKLLHGRYYLMSWGVCYLRVYRKG